MKLKSLIAAMMAVGAMASAQAVPLVLFEGTTQLEDDNREYLVKGTNPLTGAANSNAGVIEVGDSLRGIIKFQALNQLNAPFNSSSPITPELTGVFQTTIAAIVDLDGVGGANDIIMAPTASFEATYGSNAVVALYTGGTPLNINSCASIATCEAAATTGGGGALWMTFGLADLDDQWTALNANLNFGLVSGLAASTKVATVNYALSILTNNSGYQFAEQTLECAPLGVFGCAGDSKTDLIGSGDVLGGAGLANGFGARSDIDAQLSVIPEPGSLALAGLALAGLGMAARRRKA